MIDFCMSTKCSLFFNGSMSKFSASKNVTVLQLYTQILIEKVKSYKEKGKVSFQD